MQLSPADALAAVDFWSVDGGPFQAYVPLDSRKMKSLFFISLRLSSKDRQ